MRAKDRTRKGMVSGKKLLLMGSSAFKADELPAVVRKRIDEAVVQEMTIIVGEAYGACRRYQDYLNTKGYSNVIVGHARSIRYNVGGWKTVKYGDDLKEREKKMIEDCDSAIIIWVDESSVIAKNLERLRRLGKPTFVYEYSSEDNTERYCPLDPTRTYARQRDVLTRSYFDTDKYGKIVEAFLASDDDMQLIDCENPSLTGYYLNKAILERSKEDVLEVRIESGSCYLIRH